MWEAYQLGKELKGTFSTEVFRYMLYGLTVADRVSHAEEVLVDYYRDCLDTSAIPWSTAQLGEGVFHNLFEMYLRAGQPNKVVEMFKEMVNRRLDIRPYIPRFWFQGLRKHGYQKQAEQLKRIAPRSKRIKWGLV